MNITKLIGMHLHNYLVFNNELDTQTYAVLKRQIDEGHDLQDRTTYPGHVTSSFALLNIAMTHVLMIHHIGLDKWLFPGGHYEGQVPPRESALREVTEETGFPKEKVRYFDATGYLAIDIDTHEIPARPSKGEGPHWHHDFLYLGVATEEVELNYQVEEVHAAKWIPLDTAANLPDERVRRSIQKIKRLIDASSEV